jgi:hypothetical protein
MRRVALKNIPLGLTRDARRVLKNRVGAQRHEKTQDD